MVAIGICVCVLKKKVTNDYRDIKIELSKDEDELALKTVKPLQKRVKFTNIKKNEITSSRYSFNPNNI
jgi:hypothetical protein